MQDWSWEPFEQGWVPMVPIPKVPDAPKPFFYEKHFGFALYRRFKLPFKPQRGYGS